jgi:ADP-ribose pyrophosphatase YjhB (NUDIX family)
MSIKYICPKGCCKYNVTPYKHSYIPIENFLENKNKIRKAGSFIYDKNTNKILLVQSRGQLWGPPKGTIQDDEEILHCAIREVKEETGIDLDEKNFEGFLIVKNKAQYYFTQMKENDVIPQNHIKDNDANGIGWFNIDCLNEMIKLKKIFINQHCRILVKKIFNKELLMNEDDSKIKRLLR